MSVLVPLAVFVGALVALLVLAGRLPEIRDEELVDGPVDVDLWLLVHDENLERLLSAVRAAAEAILENLESRRGAVDRYLCRPTEPSSARTSLHATGRAIDVGGTTELVEELEELRQIVRPTGRTGREEQ